MTFDRRRQDMEMRMQEAQLEAELSWMEKNPGKTPPWIEARLTGRAPSTVDFVPEEPKQTAPLSLGLDFQPEEEAKPERGPDGKFKKKE